MSGTAVRSIALYLSNREKRGAIARFMARQNMKVEVLDERAFTISESAECVIAEAATLEPDDIRTLLERRLALVAIGNNNKHSVLLKKIPFLRVLPARASSALVYASALELCAMREATLASHTLVDAVQDQLRVLLSSVPDMVYILDEGGNFIYLNASVRLLGYEPQELIGRHFGVIIHPEDRPNISRDIVLEKIHQANKFPDTPPKLFDERRSGQRMTRDLEVRLIHKDGHIIYSLVNAYGERNFDMPLLSDVVGQHPQTIGVVHDVSAMHLYQQSLEDSLATKEQLLREIHHRVKTNLQLVASLTHLKQIDEANADASGALRELEAQIRSIALVHETLYQSERVEQISTKDFFARFCNAAEEALETIGSTVHLKCLSDDRPFDPDRLVSLSLALLELLGGAYRYAYEKRKEIAVSIRFICADGGQCRLEVEGEGVVEKAGTAIMRALLEGAGASLSVLEAREGRERCILRMEQY